MQAREIMTTPVVTVRPGTPIRDAAAVLLDQGITAAPVVDEDDEIVGMVSEGDLVVGHFAEDPRSHVRPVHDEPPGPRTVGEVMSTMVIALGPSADAADLARAMVDDDIRSIPIVEGASVLGIVSRRDLLRTLVRDDADIRADILDRLARSGTPADRWDVQVEDGAVALVGLAGGDDARAVVALARTVPGVSAVRTTASAPST
ncbi:MAG TPA: CBS domain-containing protein [Mycobacteriales bacterium]|nr:CBS domain-containing protein [Mycobacteriales bacterium]